MRCFELLKKVLDDAYGEIPGPEAAKDKTITKELERLAQKYRDLTVYANVDYSDPVTRFAYVRTYVTSHANLVYQLISRSRALQECLQSEHVQVSCIGGGPGSDLLGIIKYLEKSGSEISLTCNIFDGETGWGETWSGLFEKVDSGLHVVHAFNSFDVVEKKSWSKFRKYLSSDLFTMIYFMSEIYGLKSEAEPYFDHLMSNAKSGALFLFVDNRRSDNNPKKPGRLFSEWFENLADRHELTILQSADEAIGLPRDEEKTEMGIYIHKFARTPKLTADIAWRVAVKE